MITYKESELYLMLFSDCIPVRGKTRASICDLTRSEIELIPSSYYDLIQEFEDTKICEVFENYDTSAHKDIDKFLNFILEKEFGTIIMDKSLFPKIQNSWESPENINNAIIDIKKIKLDFIGIVEQLDRLSCKFLQIRIFESIYTLNELSQIHDLFVDSSIHGIELIIKYQPEFSDSDYGEFFERNLLLASLHIHSSEEDKILDINFGYDGESEDVINDLRQKIYFTKEILRDSSSCGKINKSYFSIADVQDVMHNSCCNGCLNKKISIDENGEIKNCPSMSTSFGNISETSLTEAYEDNEFKKLWNITKDQILVCQDCEFRLVCTDCRAYLENPEDLYSKPLKCGYNPTTGKWSDWKNDESKKSAIEFYNLK